MIAMCQRCGAGYERLSAEWLPLCWQCWHDYCREHRPVLANPKGDDVTLEFIDEPSTEHINVLLYGPSKSGKTTGAASAPGLIAYLNCDTPNALHYARLRDTENRLKVVKFKGFETLIDISQLIDQELNAEVRMLDTVVVDTVGDLHRRLLEEESKRAIRPSLNQYGDVSTHIERFCRWLCEMPVNAIFVCHDYPVKDEASGIVERLPWTGTTNPALGSKIMGMVDVVAYTGVAETEDGIRYMSQLLSTGGRRGGDRFGVLGAYRETNLAEWFSIIAGETSTTTPEGVAA